MSSTFEYPVIWGWGCPSEWPEVWIPTYSLKLLLWLEFQHVLFHYRRSKLVASVLFQLYSSIHGKNKQNHRKKWSKHSEIFYNIQSMLYTGLSPHIGHVTKIRWPSQTKWKQRVVKIFHISLLAMISYNNPVWYKGMWIIFQCDGYC